MKAAIYRISGYLVGTVDSLGDENVLKTIMKNRFGDYPGAKFQQLHVEKSKTFDVEKNFANPEFQDNCDLALLEQYFDYGDPIQSDREVIVGARYRHFKIGKIVTVVGIGRHTENEQPLVAYTYEGKMWFRPYDMFVSEVDHEKYPDSTQKYRFELVEQPCTHCDGKGYLEYEAVVDGVVKQRGKIKCKYCEGTGCISKEHN